MFPDIGGVEMIIVGVVALLVVKPKDLPVMMRKIGEFMGRARRMANDFRASFEDMARQSELDDLRKQVETMRATAQDPMGLGTAMRETEAEIQEGLGDTTYNYGAQTEHVPWEDPATVEQLQAEPQVEAKPARKRAPKKVAAAPEIVEGGPKPKAARKTPAKTAAAAPKAARAKTPKIVS